jgi:hypothetical protein
MNFFSSGPKNCSPQSNRRLLAQKIEYIDCSNEKKNVFVLPPENLNIMDKGPRFNESGQIIKHSILGKPEWFLKANCNELKPLPTEFQDSHPPQITINSSKVMSTYNKRPFSAYQTFTG